MKQVLMIAYFFPPMGDGGVFRSLKLNRYLPEHGWRPTVICGRPEDYWIRDESLLKQLPDDLMVHRVGGITGQALLRRLGRRGGSRGKAGAGGSRSSSLFKHLRTLGDFALLPDSYAGWISAAVKKGEELIRRGDFDLIYSSSPPDSSHVAAGRLAKKSGLPWVADFRDPWINLHLKNPPSSWHRWRHRRMEQQVMSRAQVVAVTEGWRRYYAERCSREPVLIRNGFDPADFAELPPATTAGVGEKIHLLHTGKLSITRSAGVLLQGLAQVLAEQPHWRSKLQITFLGPRESDNESAADALGLSDIVQWRDSACHAESLALQRSADLLLLIKHDDPRYRDLIPGKFYEYVAADRPIFAVTPPGEIESLMTEYDLGWTVRPRCESIASGLLTALATLEKGVEPRGVAARELTRPWQAEQMAALFDRCLVR